MVGWVPGDDQLPGVGVRSGCQRLIPTAPVIIFRQSIATFNSPGKSRSVNPTGLIQLLPPATLYITSETGSVEYA